MPVPGCPAAAALDPCDLAAVKLPVGRPKDLALVSLLLASGRIKPATLRSRLDSLPVPNEHTPRLLANFALVTRP